MTMNSELKRALDALRYVVAVIAVAGFAVAIIG